MSTGLLRVVVVLRTVVVASVISVRVSLMSMRVVAVNTSPRRLAHASGSRGSVACLVRGLDDSSTELGGMHKQLVLRPLSLSRRGGRGAGAHCRRLGAFRLCERRDSRLGADSCSSKEGSAVTGAVRVRVDVLGLGLGRLEVAMAVRVSAVRVPVV